VTGEKEGNARANPRKKRATPVLSGRGEMPPIPKDRTRENGAGLLQRTAGMERESGIIKKENFQKPTLVVKKSQTSLRPWARCGIMGSLGKGRGGEFASKESVKKEKKLIKIA